MKRAYIFMILAFLIAITPTKQTVAVEVKPILKLTAGTACLAIAAFGFMSAHKASQDSHSSTPALRSKSLQPQPFCSQQYPFPSLPVLE